MAFPTFLTLNVPGEGYSRNTSCAPNPIYFFDTITWSILRLASSQLTTIIHWPFYCTAHFNVAFHVCDRMWSFRVLANLWSFCYCLFIYVLPLVIQLSRVERARVAQWVRLLDYLTTHTSLSQIRRGFAPGFVYCKKDALDSQQQVIKYINSLPMVGGSLRVLWLLPPLKLVAWYSWNIAESGVKTPKIKSNQEWSWLEFTFVFLFQARTIISYIIYHGLFRVQWIKVRGDCW